MQLKYRKAGIWVACIAVVITAAAAGSLAAENEPGAATAVQSVSKNALLKKRTRSRRSRRAHPGEKETEGTEAPNRFKADTVIWSPYRLNGKPLEVDPD